MIVACPCVNLRPRLVTELEFHGAAFIAEREAYIGLYRAIVTFDLNVGHSRGGLERLSNPFFSATMYCSLTHW